MKRAIVLLAVLLVGAVQAQAQMSGEKGPMGGMMMGDTMMGGKEKPTMGRQMPMMQKMKGQHMMMQDMTHMMMDMVKMQERMMENPGPDEKARMRKDLAEMKERMQKMMSASDDMTMGMMGEPPGPKGMPAEKAGPKAGEHEQHGH